MNIIEYLNQFFYSTKNYTIKKSFHKYIMSDQESQNQPIIEINENNNLLPDILKIYEDVIRPISLDINDNLYDYVKDINIKNFTAFVLKWN